MDKAGKQTPTQRCKPELEVPELDSAFKRGLRRLKRDVAQHPTERQVAPTGSHARTMMFRCLRRGQSPAKAP